MYKAMVWSEDSKPMPKLSLADPNKWTQLAATSSSRFRYDNYKIWYRCFRTCDLKYMYVFKHVQGAKLISLPPPLIYLNRAGNYYFCFSRCERKFRRFPTCFSVMWWLVRFPFNERTDRNRVACPVRAQSWNEIFIGIEVFEVVLATNGTYITKR